MYGDVYMQQKRITDNKKETAKFIQNWDLAIAKLFRGEEANKARVPVVKALHRVEKVSHKSSTSPHRLFSLRQLFIFSRPTLSNQT